VHSYKNRQATKQQFLDHIRNEIRLLDECKRVIKVGCSSGPWHTRYDRLVVLQEMQENPKYRRTDFIVERNNARIVCDFSRNIFNLFEKMLKLFPVCNVLLKEFIDFSVDNVSDETVRLHLRIIVL